LATTFDGMGRGGLSRYPGRSVMKYLKYSNAGVR